MDENTNPQPEGQKVEEPKIEVPKAEQEGDKKENVSGGKDKDVEENKLWALLSYLGVLVLIPLLGKKDSPFAQFHAKQGLVLLIGWIVSWFPVFGWIIGIIAFVLSIIGIIGVLNGEKKKLPIVGDLAEKINI